MINLREKNGKKFYNKIDPVYFFLNKILFERIFNPPKENQPNKYYKLENAEIDFLVENISKHRAILWLNILLSIFLMTYGLEIILTTGNSNTVVTGLLAPAMITGAAWFAVSFGGIPPKFIRIAFILTFSMFLSFTLSMTLLTMLLMKITPWFIAYFVILPIYISLYISSILYDNVDGLKIGLDSTLLKFSRAAINYYRKHNLVTHKETQGISFSEEIDSEKIAILTYYINTLERNINQLEEEKTLKIANHLIATSLDILFNILDKSNSHKLKIDKGNEFDNFVNNAYNLDQSEVDIKTKEFLNIIIHHLKRVIGEIATDEINRIEKRLNQINLNNSEKELVENISMSENQHFADHIFSQTFRTILELISAYRHILLNN